MTSNQVKMESNASSSSPSVVLLSDNPCWGSPDACSLSHLLTKASRTDLVLLESPDYLILNKPPDVRMDGPYPTTVYKLLTYWYPPPSLQALSQEELMCRVTNHVHQSKDVRDFELRPCHQLDYATSGVLLVARNGSAAAKAVESFERRRVTKVYLALVHGHVHAHQVLQNYTRDSNCAIISQEYLNDFMKTTERAYQRSRQRQQRKPNSCSGCLPAHTLFQKWQSFRRRHQHPAQSLDDKQSQEEEEKMSKRPRTNPAPLASLEDWNQIWKATTDHLTDEEQTKVDLLEWRQVKLNVTWKDTFVKASKLYNEQIRAALAVATPEPASTVNDTLPTVFRVQDDDNHDRFYIYAATAEVPNQFAVQVAEKSRLFLADATHGSGPLSTVSLPTSKNNSDCIDLTSTTCNDTMLDYKPSLTQCTILDHAYLEMKGARLPVTKVRLEPKTGRRHQLRVHMAQVVGAPIVQDMTYARPETIDGATLETATSTLANTFKDSTTKSGNVEAATPLSPPTENNGTTNHRGESHARSLRMCLHAHALKISLRCDHSDNQVATAKVITAIAPDPFVIDAQAGEENLVQILNF
jgi:23S rRNA-/tRNA-specific pseudouridylate synthase